MKRRRIVAALTAVVVIPLVPMSATAADVPDPLAPGPHQVAETAYTLGDTAFQPPNFPGPVELTGQAYYPADVENGPYPTVVLLHGRHAPCYVPGSPNATGGWPCEQGALPIPSHLGYGELGRSLASHGFAVISVSANGINAADALDPAFGQPTRGELVLAHLDLLRRWSGEPGGALPQNVAKAFDLGQVGLMGHSRGGEGVVNALELNAQRTQRYGIKALLPLAATDFERRVPTGLPMATLLPTCDGDVADLQGVHYYDDARYTDANDVGVQHIFTIFGANHNYFNTNWSPSSGLAAATDDWRSSNTGSQCHPSQSTRLTEDQQRKAGNGYLGSFFRHYLGGESAFAPLWKGEAGTPKSIAPANVLMSYHGPSVNGRRLDVNRFDTAESLQKNQLGGQVVLGGTLTARLCGGTPSTQDASCLNTKQVSRQREPHRGWGTLGVSAQRVLWGHISDTLNNSIPLAYQDVRKFGAVRFRAAVDFTDPANPAGAAQDLQVVIMDRAGQRASVPVAQFQNPLLYPHVPPGTPDVIPHFLFNQVRVPLSAFTGVDLSRVDMVYLAFNKTPKGAVAISDLSFTD